MKLRKRKPVGKQTIKYIEQLYTAYSKRMYYIANNYVKDPNLAQDIVQIVFERALLYPNTILKVPQDEIIFFLTTMVRNTAFSILKEEKNNAHEELVYDNGNEGDYVEDPTDNYLQMIDLESLKEKLNKLPARLRDTLLFRYVYGFKCKEIAEMFEITERSVKMRCSEARRELKSFFEEDGDILD